MEAEHFFSSQITFLNCRGFDRMNRFLSDTLGLHAAYDIGWAVVYAVSGGAFLGVVDHSRGAESSESKDSMLISLTTSEIEAWHERVSADPLIRPSEIRELPDAGLKSFFFTGPEGFRFEIQQFLLPEGRRLF